MLERLRLKVIDAFETAVDFNLRPHSDDYYHHAHAVRDLFFPLVVGSPETDFRPPKTDFDIRKFWESVFDEKIEIIIYAETMNEGVIPREGITDDFLKQRSANKGYIFNSTLSLFRLALASGIEPQTITTKAQEAVRTCKHSP